MKKILLMSDNHGDAKITEIIIKKFKKEVDYVIHCGDSLEEEPSKKYQIVVSGNSENQSSLEKEVVVSIEGHNILVTHGDAYESFFKHKMKKNLSEAAISKNCDIVFYGHVHSPTDDVVDGVRLISPGALKNPRSVLGKSFMIISISKDNVIVNLHEVHTEPEHNPNNEEA